MKYNELEDLTKYCSKMYDTYQNLLLKAIKDNSSDQKSRGLMSKYVKNLQLLFEYMKLLGKKGPAELGVMVDNDGDVKNLINQIRNLGTETKVTDVKSKTDAESDVKETAKKSAENTNSTQDTNDADDVIILDS